MTKSKTHFVKQICSLKEIPLDSDEAKDLLERSVVELLTMIKDLKAEPEPEPEPEPEVQQTPEPEPEPTDHQAPVSDSESEEDDSFASRCGSRFR